MNLYDWSLFFGGKKSKIILKNHLLKIHNSAKVLFTKFLREFILNNN